MGIHLTMQEVIGVQTVHASFAAVVLSVQVALRRARLVLGWVTVYGQVNHLGPKPAS